MMIYYFMMLMGVFVYISSNKKCFSHAYGVGVYIVSYFLLMVDYLCNMGGENQFLLIYVTFVLCECSSLSRVSYNNSKLWKWLFF